MLRKLYIEPTTKCNLNCKMCFRHTWFDEPICDLSLADFRRVLDTMPSSVETIFFGGMGEPLFHRDILQMVRLAADTGAEVELLTNGTLLSEEMILGLIEAGLGRLWVSIDNLESHSSINGQRPDVSGGSGHDHSGQVLENIRRFNRLRQKHGGGIALGITFVAMRSNVHQLGLLPFFIAQHLVDSVNISNISPTDRESQREMLYTGLVNMYTGPGKNSVLPTVELPYFDMNVPEAAEGIRAMFAKQNFHLFFNGQSVLRRAGYCKFVREGMTFVRADGKVAACMALLHNGYTWLHDIRRKITHCAFGSIMDQPLSDIWNSDEYRAFRRKFDDFDFASCLYCGHCELFAENQEDCIGNTHPACGGCLWAEGVLSCP